MKEIDIKPPFDFYNLETGELKKVNSQIMERAKGFKLKIGDPIFISDDGEELLFYDYLEFCDRNNQIVVASQQFIRDKKLKQIGL